MKMIVMMEKNCNTDADIVRSYMRYLKLERNYSPNTLDAYRSDIQKLIDYLETSGRSVREVTADDLHGFIATLHDLGVGAVSQCRVLSGLRSLFRFMVLDGFRDDDPTEFVESPKTGEHLPEVLSVDEVDRMEAAIDLSKPEGHRNRAIVEVMFSCGLRVSELIQLRLSDL